MKQKNKIHYGDIKSLFISCKNCGSKLATKYITSNTYPLCRQDLRPNYVLEKCSKYKNEIDELNKKIKEEEKKQKKKLEKTVTIKWLVKIEYHT